MTPTEKLERIVDVQAAFDKRDPDPNKSYGIHCAQMIFVLKGAMGAVQFVIFTGWHLPHVAAEFWAKGDRTARLLLAPTGADVGYHSPVPQYEGQTPMGSSKIKWVDGKLGEKELKVPESVPTGTFDPCPYLDGRPCYYDGSGLAGEKMLELLIASGSDAVWAALEQRYHDLFGAADAATHAKAGAE